MVQIWERCKSLQLVNPIYTDHAMYTWRDKLVSISLKCHQDIKIVEYFGI